VDLVRGQRAKLADLTPAARLRVGVTLDGPGRDGVQCVALLLGESQEAISHTSIVSADRPASECGGVAHRGQNPLEPAFDLDLVRLPTLATNLLFAVGFRGVNGGELGSARAVRRGSWWVEADGVVVARYAFTGAEFGDDAAVTLGEVYRKSGVWRLRAIGDGFVGGLPALLSRFRVVLGRAAGPDISAAPAGFRLPAAWPGGQTPAVPKGLTRGVGLVVARTGPDAVHTGTGFAVSPGGHFLTCQHVVEGATDLSICLDGTQVLRPAEVIAQSPEADLALCWISDRNGCPDWLLLAGPDDAPSLGDDLGLLGFPLGVNLGLNVTYSQGIVNSLRQKNGVSVLQIDVGAAPGSSGGPVFRRRDGKVVGVLTSGLDVADRGMLINFAVEIRMLTELGWLGEPEA